MLLCDCDIVTESRAGCLPQQKPNPPDRCWWEGRWFNQVRAPWEDEGLMSQSPSSLLSAGRGFYKEGEGNQNKETKGGGCLKSSLRAHKHSPLWSGKWWPGICHAGLDTQAPWLKVSKSARAGMPKGWSPSFEVSSQHSYTNMLFIYKPCISQSQHLQKQWQKNSGVGYTSPLLQPWQAPFSMEVEGRSLWSWIRKRAGPQAQLRRLVSNAREIKEIRLNH